MIRLSYSTLENFHTCERLFQLDRLLVSEFEKKDYPATVQGKAFGEAVTTYLATQDPDKALFKLWQSYFPELSDNKRSQEICCFLFLRAQPQLDILLQDWELATFNGKPAIELSFRINIDSDFYYVGYIDAVLKNRWTGQGAILENKTTSLLLHDLSPLYQNSGQALGYSIVLDQILGEASSSYDLLYLVGQLGKTSFSGEKVQLLTFPKTLQDRLHWFISLGLDVNRIKEMQELGVFPRRGGSCLSYMKPCKHFGTCNLHGLDQPKIQEPDLIDYDFTFDLQTVIEDHLRRIGA